LRADAAVGRSVADDAAGEAFLQGIHEDMEARAEKLDESGSSVWSPFWERSMIGSVEMWREDRGRSIKMIDSLPCFIMAHDEDGFVALGFVAEGGSVCELPLVRTSRSEP
jgi:hypothetical protein